MLTVAYLANQYPAAVEPYVGEEIHELRRRGITIVASSARMPAAELSSDAPDVCLQPIRWILIPRTLILLAQGRRQMLQLLTRLFTGREKLGTRFKALLHTGLGAYYAALLQEGGGVDHIHVHHGYFGAWVAMVAARLLKVDFSMTLHGSDLLLHGVYLDTKLDNCSFCLTVSEYNRQYILRKFQVDGRKIVLSRLGVDVPVDSLANNSQIERQRPFTLLAAGRLHVVKNHAFLIHACARLRDSGVNFECLIAGDGPECERLKLLIRGNRLHDQTKLLGHVSRERMQSLYRAADLFVLTSISEGIPLVLMEAMASGTVVLAPSITGIPELVVTGRSGFLYTAGDLEDFVDKVFTVEAMMRNPESVSIEELSRIRESARFHVLQNFDRHKNIRHFADTFLQLIAHYDWSPPHENPVLQQI